jgi:hypothetical protein
MDRFFTTEPFFKKNGTAIALYFLIAIIFWIVFLVIIPQLYMLDLSFKPNLYPLERGGPKAQRFLHRQARALNRQGDPREPQGQQTGHSFAPSRG